MIVIEKVIKGLYGFYKDIEKTLQTGSIVMGMFAHRNAFSQDIMDFY